MILNKKPSWGKTSCARVLSALVFVASATAQTRAQNVARSYTVSKVEITLEPACTVEPDIPVFLVLNGVDVSRRATWRDDRWVIRDAPRIDPAKAMASVRIGKTGRSDCQPSELKEDVEQKGQYVAAFHFSWCSQNARIVTVETEEPIDVGYVRTFARCVGHNTILGGVGAISNLAFPKEQLRLQLGTQTPRIDGLGLKVNSLLDTKGTTAEPKLVPRAGVVQALIEQRAKGDGSAPNFSTPAIDIDHHKLSKLGLKVLKLTVK